MTHVTEQQPPVNQESLEDADTKLPPKKHRPSRRARLGATVCGVAIAGGALGAALAKTVFSSHGKPVAGIEQVLGQNHFDIYHPGKHAPKPTNTQIKVEASSASATGYIAVAANPDLAPCFTEEVVNATSTSAADPTFLREPQEVVNPLTGHVDSRVNPSQEPAFHNGQEYAQYVNRELAASHGVCDPPQK